MLIMISLSVGTASGDDDPIKNKEINKEEIIKGRGLRRTARPHKALKQPTLA